MKRYNYLAIAAVAFSTLFVSCETQNDQEPDASSAVPTKFAVDIPDAISSEESFKTANKTVDTLRGGRIYRHLRAFIRVGEGAAEIVQGTMWAIAHHNINHAMELTFTSDEDGREKNLVVVENSDFEDRTWELQLTITDAASEDSTDGGKAIQVFWNRSPVEGIAIMKPYNINRKDQDVERALFRVDYSEAGELGYDNHMFVSISDLPVASPNADQFATRSMQMFAGRTGDIVDVYGNTNHPNAKLFNDDTGFNWAFVASSDRGLKIGTAEVGLPPSNLDSENRSELLVDHSIETVFRDQINEVYPEISEEDLDAYLTNAQAPGYFSHGGFVQAEVAPSNNYDAIANRIISMKPFNPNSVSNLSVEFK